MPPRAPHHRLHVQERIAGLDLRADLSAPWTVLFGPSGCGKSTALRALAGLVPATNLTFTRYIGRNHENLSVLSPQRRGLGYAPQQAALFPHLTVAENVAFPLQVRGVRPQPRLAELLALLALEPLAHRRPQELSGGERQRVALARALAVPDAHLLLLDEPFTGVDRTLRDRLLPGLRTWIAGHAVPVLSVTHDIDEALSLEAEVIRLEASRNAAQGPARAILAPEITRLRTLLNPADTP